MQNRLCKFLIFMLAMGFSMGGCKKTEEKIEFDFEQIQNHYWRKIHSGGFSYFYSEEKFSLVEDEINELIKNSDCCAVQISISANNAKLYIRLLYGNDENINFREWNLYTENEKHCLVQDEDAKKILEYEPKKTTIIDDTGLVVLDGMTVYAIKKTKNGTYYYANNQGSMNKEYTELGRLFFRIQKKLAEEENKE